MYLSQLDWKPARWKAKFWSVW